MPHLRVTPPSRFSSPFSFFPLFLFFLKKCVYFSFKNMSLLASVQAEPPQIGFSLCVVLCCCVVLLVCVLVVVVVGVVVFVVAGVVVVVVAVFPHCNTCTNHAHAVISVPSYHC